MTIMMTVRKGVNKIWQVLSVRNENMQKIADVVAK